jgi:hypothetical protein
MEEMNKQIEPHDQKKSCWDLKMWPDLAVLEQAFAHRRTKQIQEWKTVPISADTYLLIASLIASGVCRDEEEIVSKAIQAFFVAVSPAFPEDILLEVAEKSTPASPR